ncbi:DNA-binding transcriptional regulator, XRE-family HTH domain [Ruminococcaceae bacterium P7]|nr:DNA-binding transcriptional regulator, XRE-family HTH domain [Ruminococcaceae bacterium P7]
MILRELREQKRISQQALGELFEVSAQTINNWECGKAEPDFEALMGLALFFGVSVDTLIGFDVKGNAADIADVSYELLEAKLSQKGIKILDGTITDNSVEV